MKSLSSSTLSTLVVLVTLVSAAFGGSGSCHGKGEKAELNSSGSRSLRANSKSAFNDFQEEYDPDHEADEQFEAVLEEEREHELLSNHRQANPQGRGYSQDKYKRKVQKQFRSANYAGSEERRFRSPCTEHDDCREGHACDLNSPNPTCVLAECRCNPCCEPYGPGYFCDTNNWRCESVYPGYK